MVGDFWRVYVCGGVVRCKQYGDLYMLYNFYLALFNIVSRYLARFHHPLYSQTSARSNHNKQCLSGKWMTSGHTCTSNLTNGNYFVQGIVQWHLSLYCLYLC